MSADGRIVIKTKVEADDAQATKELERLNRRIQTLEDKISKNKQLKLQLLPESNELEAALDSAKAKLAEMQSGGPFASSDKIKEQEETVRSLQARWDAIQNEVDKYDKNIKSASIDLEKAQERAGEITQNMVSGTEATNGMTRAVAAADARMEKFVNRVKGLAKRVFVFSLITAALRSLRGWLGSVIQANDETAAAMARLKGALLTLAQPLLSVLIPALTVVINLLARLVTVAAQLMALIFGKSIKQTSAAAKAMNAEKVAIEGVGSAAKETAKNLSGLDEINTWDSGSSDAGGGGGVSGGDGIAPNFDLDDLAVDEGRLKDILGLIEAIGLALLTWKLSKMFGLGLKESIALFIAMYGAIEFVKGIVDAWSNDVSWDNIQQMIFGLTLAVVGLYVAFGPVAAGIAMIVGGLAMLVTGFRDAMENGFNLQNMLLTLTGIIVTGLGISVLTGTMIPLLIASIAALLLAIVVFTGHGEELLNGLKDVFGGFIDFIVGVFTGDWERAMAGIERSFAGLKAAIGAILDGVKDLFLKALDWLDEKTHGKFHGIIEFIKNFVTVTFNGIKDTVGKVVDGIKQIFAGVVTFLRGVFTSDFDMAWRGVKQIFVGAWNAIISALEGAVNLIIRGVNWLISQLNKIHVDIPSWVPGIGGKSVGINIPDVSYASIPRLAKGAVIPPNREFMAVLGDQKSGNNIETPEALLRQIMREEMPRNGGSYRFTAQINRRVLFDQMIEEGKLRQVSTGRNPFTSI